MESNDSPETPDRGKTSSDIPGLPSGAVRGEKRTVKAWVQLHFWWMHQKEMSKAGFIHISDNKISNCQEVEGNYNVNIMTVDEQE